MSKKQEYILIDGRRYKKFIRYPQEVCDGTCRCITCGQIDDDPWHDADICQKERSKIWDARIEALKGTQHDK